MKIKDAKKMKNILKFQKRRWNKEKENDKNENNNNVVKIFHLAKKLIKIKTEKKWEYNLGPIIQFLKQNFLSESPNMYLIRITINFLEKIDRNNITYIIITKIDVNNNLRKNDEDTFIKILNLKIIV